MSTFTEEEIKKARTLAAKQIQDNVVTKLLSAPVIEAVAELLHEYCTENPLPVGAEHNFANKVLAVAVLAAMLDEK